MNRHTRDGRSGQALPLFVILVPGLLALMAMGIDGANVYLAKRDAQGAADLAAVSGAKLLPDKVAATALAETIGIANGYLADEVTPDADYGDDTQILVTVERDVPTYFMPILNFFGVGDWSTWNVDARAVAQHDPGSSSSGDYALFALQQCGEKEDFKALNWSGENNTVNGSAHTNAGTTISGNQTTVTNEFSVTCTGSNISDKYSFNEGGTNPNISPDGDQNVPDCDGTEAPGEACRQDLPIPAIPFYDHATRTVDTSAIAAICDGPANRGDVDVTGTVNGNFCSLDGKIVIKDTASTTSGVTFFGKEIIIGDPGLTFTQPNYQGVLMYAVTSEEGKGIDYSGNSGTFEGLWYSPLPSSKVQFQGNDNDLVGALVGYQVDYSGNFNTITGNFGPSAGAPPSVALIE